MESYFEKRLSLLGITPDDNQVMLWRSANIKGDDGITRSGQELYPVPIFRQHEKGIEIIVYTLDRLQPKFDNSTVDDDGKQKGSRIKKHWSIIRLEKPIVKPNGDTIKYLMPKGQGSYPFIPPQLLDKFDKREKVHTLYLTEGYFKAFKGAMHGIDIIGLPSITHLKDKDKGALHPDITKIIDLLGVERVVWLTDGDALDVSSKAFDPKEEVDLYKRPYSFYASISTFKQLLDDKDVEKYFMHVDTDNIMQEIKAQDSPATNNITRNDVKGLDDVLVAFPDRIPEIVADLNSVSTKGNWFQKFKVTIGMSKVREYFRLRSPLDFILFQYERNPKLKGRDFIFNGSKYRYNEEKGEVELLLKGDPKLYFRVGDDYYKWVEVPNQYKQIERQFHPRSKTTISDDHGKEFIKHIAKYEAFCNVPDHLNYQPIHNDCFNVYSEIEHKPDETAATPEDFEAIYQFLHHIFGDNTATFTDINTREKKTYRNLELGLDYLQLLYLNPQRKLPILCLVSKENSTGKSTFANFLRLMLGANVAIVGNADLAGDFNAHWATKSVVVCDETKIDKQHVIEKIKALSTARKIFMNAKGKGQVELDCFIKFVLITNNEENFIYASDDDIRYWVIKVPVLKADNPHIVDQFVQEMPAFLSFLSKRKLATEDKSRMWFHPTLLKTEALKKVIEHSMPTIQKELKLFIEEKFFDFGVDEFMMTLKDIHKDCFNGKFEANYLQAVLRDKLKLEKYGTSEKYPNGVVHRYSYPRWETVTTTAGKPPEQIRVDVSSQGRPYVFKRSQFIKEGQLADAGEENRYINGMTPTANEELPFR